MPARFAPRFRRKEIFTAGELDQRRAPRPAVGGDFTWTRIAALDLATLRGALVLVEAAWAGRLRPSNESKHVKKRQEGLSEAVIDIGWRTQKRLYKRYTSMRARMKPQNVIIVAMARELVGVIWAIGIQTASEQPTTTPA